MNKKGGFVVSVVVAGSLPLPLTEDEGIGFDGDGMGCWPASDKFVI
jgi:hypothetical protein